MKKVAGTQINVTDTQINITLDRSSYERLLTKLVNRDLDSNDRFNMDWIYWAMAEEIGICDASGNLK